MATLLSNQSQKTQTQPYPTDQQVKYLHLEAEVDILLQRITALMQRKQVFSCSSTISSDSQAQIDLS
ncbi:MAG: hypothetical protein AAGE84_02875 [Cyanobacteria bacterium P01_G01_bin.39]